MLKFKVENQKLIKQKDDFVVADSRNYTTVGFLFSDDWDDVIPKVATFSRDEDSYDVFIENGECTIPWEVLSKEGRLDISVSGGDLLTTNVVSVVVHKSGVGNLFPTVASPSVYSYVVELSQNIEQDWNNCKALLDAYKSDIANENAELDKRIQSIDNRLSDINATLTRSEQNIATITDKYNEILAMIEQFKSDYADMLNDLDSTKTDILSEINSVYTANVSSINTLADSIKADISKGGADIDNKIADGISAVNSAKTNAITALDAEIENFKRCDWIYKFNPYNKTQIASVVDIFNNLTIPKTINGVDTSTLLWNVNMAGLCCNKIDLTNIKTNGAGIGGNKFIKHITYGNIRIYGDIAFARGSDVEYVVFNNTEPVPDLPAYSFYDCIKLKSIKLGEGITSCFHCFTHCTSLTNVTFPSTMKEISYYSFWDCSSLATITIPESVETIHSTAFGGGCSKLKTITINKPADSIPGAPWGAANATVVWKGGE